CVFLRSPTTGLFDEMTNEPPTIFDCAKPPSQYSSPCGWKVPPLHAPGTVSVKDWPTLNGPPFAITPPSEISLAKAWQPRSLMQLNVGSGTNTPVYCCAPPSPIKVTPASP